MHRRRRLAVGMVLAAIGAGASWLGVAGATDPTESGVAAAEAPPVSLALAAVDAAGSMRSAEPGWQATKIDVGTYELSFPREVRLAVGTWSAVADVTARPVSTTTWVVTFRDAGEDPVDSAFTFLASPAG